MGKRIVSAFIRGAGSVICLSTIDLKQPVKSPISLIACDFAAVGNDIRTVMQHNITEKESKPSQLIHG